MSVELLLNCIEQYSHSWEANSPSHTQDLSFMYLRRLNLMVPNPLRPIDHTNVRCSVQRSGVGTEVKRGECVCTLINVYVCCNIVNICGRRSTNFYQHVRRTGEGGGGLLSRWDCLHHLISSVKKRSQMMCITQRLRWLCNEYWFWEFTFEHVVEDLREPCIIARGMNVFSGFALWACQIWPQTFPPYFYLVS